MRAKRSRGVTIAGGFLLLFGLWGFIFQFIGNAFFLWNRPLWLKFVSYLAYSFKSLRTSGAAIPQIADMVDYFIGTVLGENPYLMLFQFILLPILAFLIFMSGRGILALRDEWRRTAMAVFLLTSILNFIIRIYVHSYLTMFIVAGKMSGSKVIHTAYEVTKTVKISSDILVKGLVFSVLINALLIFFLTRPKVRRQFRKKKEAATV
jgi:hypothetical protein